uniref:Uncharacterized protein n=1 Tax=Nothobranchius furzeri TaxID=105023 RepID=A0A1A8B190_NOTFU
MRRINVHQAVQIVRLFFELEAEEVGGDSQPESEANSEDVDDDVADPSFLIEELGHDEAEDDGRDAAPRRSNKRSGRRRAAVRSRRETEPLPTPKCMYIIAKLIK